MTGSRNGIEVDAIIIRITSFGYENPNIIGKYGLKYNNSLDINLFIGLKNVNLLGINFDIGDIEKGWEWHLPDKYPRLKDGDIIPETELFEMEL